MNEHWDVDAPTRRFAIGKRPWRTAALILFPAVAFHALVVVPVVFYVPYTCVYCRARRVDKMALRAVTSSSIHSNPCSEWYDAHVEPSHAHLWAVTACVVETNALGMVRGLSYPAGVKAISAIPPSLQLRVYQRFDRPGDAKRLFESLVDDKSLEGWNRDDRSELMLDKALAIRDWESSGFPATWERWWPGWLARASERLYQKLARDRPAPTNGFPSPAARRIVPMRPTARRHVADGSLEDRVGSGGRAARWGSRGPA